MGILEMEEPTTVSCLKKIAFTGTSGKILTIRLYRYWEFLALLTLSLLVLQTLLTPTPTTHTVYTTFIGYLGLAIEATLPLPQILANRQLQSCKGFRVSVLANWLFGDAMKMMFFFASDAGKVPWAFKACGIFQAACDLGLGIQYWTYGNGQIGDVRDKDIRLG